MRGTLQEDAFSGTAARFFNTMVNVTTQEERILTWLMTGLTFGDLYLHVANGSLSGLPADLTIDGLDRSKYMFAEAKTMPTLRGVVATIMCYSVIALGYQTSSQGVNSWDY